MAWVSNKVLTDIRTELFGKMLGHSMDFFNKMRSGFLMSRITNDTRMMQTALAALAATSSSNRSPSSAASAVLLYMDWKFTIVTLVLFPSCLDSVKHVWQTGPQGGEARAGRTGTDGRDDAGNLRRHSGGQILRPRRASGEIVPAQQPDPVR